jgi:hypothetical protein
VRSTRYEQGPYIRITCANRINGIIIIIIITIIIPVRSCWPPIGRLPRWRIGEGSPDMLGTGEIKYKGRTKTSHYCFIVYEVGPSKARGRKP